MKTLWPAKIAAKMVLARLPVSYATWRRLGLFKAGAGNQAQYALRVFMEHFRHAPKRPDFTMLELGPGDGPLMAVIAAAHGAERCYLVDVADQLDRDRERLETNLQFLAERLPTASGFVGLRSIDEVLQATGGFYMIEGLASLKTIPSDTIDFVCSQSTLEHVFASEFDETMAELRRIMRPGGTMSHWVDFKDHLVYGANNLRFSTSVWESPLFVGSGFYTNRIRVGGMLERMRAAGFEAQAVEVRRWDEPPLSRRHLAPEFRHLSDDDLTVSAARLVCRIPAAAGITPRRRSKLAKPNGATA